MNKLSAILFVFINKLIIIICCADIFKVWDCFPKLNAHIMFEIQILLNFLWIGLSKSYVLSKWCFRWAPNQTKWPLVTLLLSHGSLTKTKGLEQGAILGLYSSRLLGLGNWGNCPYLVPILDSLNKNRDIFLWRAKCIPILFRFCRFSGCLSRFGHIWGCPDFLLAWVKALDSMILQNTNYKNQSFNTHCCSDWPMTFTGLSYDGRQTTTTLSR